ncbi:MAG: hypothetical protein IJT68_08870 [Lentisphaeria bacterium]|nr:hypothetical protein [Lentisphaeria bacterium]
MRQAIDMIKDVRNEMRRRVIAALGSNMNKRWQLPNAAIKKPSDGIWIRESVNEGSEEPLTNVASREYAVVNYEVFCEAAKGADAADEAIRIIRNELPVIGEKSIVYQKGRRQAVIRSIDKPAGGISPDDPTWYRRMISFTLYLYNV